LKNRFVRSATYEACASEQGQITDKTTELYSRLAQGGVGLIITGVAHTHRKGLIDLHETAIYSDEFIPGLRRLADKVHEHDVKIAIQLNHAGRNSPGLRARGETPLAPSYLENDPYWKLPHRAMTTEEIEETIDSFGQAARRAREAGFDAIQLHAAHSWLLSEFLSPYSNRRADQWGGTLDNRMRFHTEVVAAIRKAVGPDYPLLIKLGVRDTIENGLTLKEGCRVAQEVAAGGIDAIEVSEGLEKIVANHVRKDVKPGKGEAYYAEWAGEVKKAVPVPVILVGGMRSFDTMEGIIQQNYADCVSMCRPFIREPDIVHRWQTGNRKPAACISCNLCMERVDSGKPLECVQEAKLKDKRW